MPPNRAVPITLLFTDIEGSTRLWDEHPEAMRAALRQHDDLLRACIESHGGQVFKTIGDAFCAHFEDPHSAIRVTLAAQQWLPALSLRDGDTFLPLKVRMAVHSGEVEPRDGDFFGPPLNRLARVLSTGHGGQVLLTGAVRDEVRDSLPEGCELRSLGEHRLKDLGRPETLYQLLHPALEAEFPPLRSLNNPASKQNLPEQVSSFIGREAELAEVRRLIRSTRLTTLTGAGGCGKTRLALHAAAELTDEFSGGVWLIELAPVGDASLLAQVVTNALGLRETAEVSPLEGLVEHLREKSALLLLDNCEHVLDAAARLVDTLLRRCAGVRILATSREGLGISGESVLRVPSLSLPDLGRTATVDLLSEFEAIRLFVERAREAQRDFALTDANAPALAQLCRRLDGIPLALELAAARTRSLTVEEINSRLDQRFRLLTGGSRTALPRQQTLRSLIDWSYDLLLPSERTMLQRLSVFSGGLTLEAAEAVCPDDGIDEWEVLDLLTSLTDKSLLVAEQRDGATRYRLLETVRQYARDRLLESGQGAAYRERHLTHYLALAKEADTRLKREDQQAWLSRLETEHDNLRAALEWARDSEAIDEPLVRLVASLWYFWYVRGHLTEGREWLTEALSTGNPEHVTEARVSALNGAGVMAWRQGDYPSARTLLTTSLDFARRLGDTKRTGAALHNLANVVCEQNDFVTARRLYEESLAVYLAAGDQRAGDAALNNLGVIAQQMGDYVEARRRFNEGLAARRRAGHRNGVASSLDNLGSLSAVEGDFDTARSLHEESLAIHREMGDRRGISYSLHNLGIVALRQKRAAEAEGLFRESLELRESIGDRRGMGAGLEYLGRAALHQGATATARDFCRRSLAIRRDIDDRQGLAGLLEAVALLAALEGNPTRAAGCWGTAERLREELVAPLPSLDREERDPIVLGCREGREVEFDQAWGEGRARTVAEACDFAFTGLAG